MGYSYLLLSRWAIAETFSTELGILLYCLNQTNDSGFGVWAVTAFSDSTKIHPKVEQIWLRWVDSLENILNIFDSIKYIDQWTVIRVVTSLCSEPHMD
jgi:hypothetical protein